MSHRSGKTSATLNSASSSRASVADEFPDFDELFAELEQELNPQPLRGECVPEVTLDTVVALVDPAAAETSVPLTADFDDISDLIWDDPIYEPVILQSSAVAVASVVALTAETTADRTPEPAAMPIAELPLPEPTPDVPVNEGVEAEPAIPTTIKAKPGKSKSGKSKAGKSRASAVEPVTVASDVVEPTAVENVEVRPATTESFAVEPMPEAIVVPSIETVVTQVPDLVAVCAAEPNPVDSEVCGQRSEVESSLPQVGARSFTFPTEAIDDLQTHLSDVCDQLREQLRESVLELKASEATIAAEHSAAMDLLSEAVCRPAPPVNCELSADVLERAFSGIERRLFDRIDGLSLQIQKLAVIPTATLIDSPLTAALEPSKPLAPIVESLVPKLAVKPGAGVRSWAEIRNEMLAAGGEFHSPTIEARPVTMPPSSAAVAAPASEPVAAPLPDVPQLTSDRHFKLPEQDPALEVPTVVDVDALSHEELKDAFREREVFIATLIARIRRQQEAHTQQLSQEQLRQLVIDLPEELATQVRYTLKQLNDLARVGELELSLERARIARQVNQLEHSRQRISNHARQVGMELHDDCTLATINPAAPKNSSSRRWLGKLGFGQ